MRIQRTVSTNTRRAWRMLMAKGQVSSDARLAETSPCCHLKLPDEAENQRMGEKNSGS
jgi:hypothetical protein